ncbi:MAG: monovalent cation/H(+) antiporter subunit G, partial [Candidatus Diapherotrites archaeon]|nr:monovalent cation/H(+) antiporter subunit G [Candidatus Diapherotrites archaeon]
MEWLIFVFIAIGLIFQALGSISLHRFPDAYTRMHGTTKCATFGS